MAWKKINQLTKITTLSNNDLILVEQSNGTNVAISKSDLSNALNQYDELSLLKKIYPVGAIYISTSSTNPASLFGFGTWEQIKDVFLLSAGNTYTAGSSGGSAEVVLTINQIPKHNHTELFCNDNYITVWADQNTKGGSAFSMNSLFQSNGPNNNTFSTGYKGSGQAHTNMPPYLVVYTFKRTA